MANGSSDSIPTPNIPRIRDPGFRDVYANVSLTGLTPYDLTLIFAKTGEFNGQPVQNELVSVTMSPQHFKAFCRSASETLKAYEAVFGELKIPDSDTAPVRDASQIETLVREGKEKAAAAMKAMVAASSPTEKQPPAKRSRGARKA
jgi:hypothetical protein